MENTKILVLIIFEGVYASNTGRAKCRLSLSQYALYFLKNILHLYLFDAIIFVQKCLTIYIYFLTQFNLLRAQDMLLQL